MDNLVILFLVFVGSFLGNLAARAATALWRHRSDNQPSNERLNRYVRRG